MEDSNQLANALIQISQLKAALRMYEEAADKFIEKVETGRARSRETYADLKIAKAFTEKVLDSPFVIN